MKILALDIGDKWVGSAISDEIGITCRPYKTVTREELDSFLKKVLFEENIGKVIVGNPMTLKGTESIQTQKTAKEKVILEKKFNMLDGSPIEWILWDERLSSKRTKQIQSQKSFKDKQAKIESHSIAAAYILQTYLDYIAFNKPSN